MQPNVLSHLPSNENSITALLRALCALKPFREIVVRLFTHNKFGSNDVEFEDISIQIDIGGIKPDMGVCTERLRVVAEIKVNNETGLTKNQPRAYSEWLARQPEEKFFVFLVPPHYGRQEYTKRKEAFCSDNPGHAINYVEINWLTLVNELDRSELTLISAYAKDFSNLLKEWYSSPPIKFTTAELTEDNMYNKTGALAICKLFDFLGKIASEFERSEYYSIDKSFNKRWWEDSDNGEYGIYIKCNDITVLWLGLWTGFWKDHGCPLCIGVARDGWGISAVRDRFQNTFPHHVIYPPNQTDPYLTKCIDQHLLMEDSVQHVFTWLQDGYLKGICDLVSSNNS